MAKKDDTILDEVLGEVTDAGEQIPQSSGQDPSMSSGQAGSDQPEPEADEKLKQLQDRVGVLEDQLKRAVADYQNLEKRIEEGRLDLSRWSTGEIIKKIVPVLDHFDQALVGASESGEKSGWMQGVTMAVKELRKVLKEEGLDEVQTDKFDPKLHEAVDVVEGEDGKILKVTQMGYNLNGKLIKPAKVVVGKKGDK